MRRRGLRRPRRRWFAWARLGALAAFVLVGGGTLLYVPSVTGQISAMGTSIKSAWDTLAERATLARQREHAGSGVSGRPCRAMAEMGGTRAVRRCPRRRPRRFRRPGRGGDPRGRSRRAGAIPATATERAASGAGRRSSGEPLRAASVRGGDGARPIVIPQGATIADIAFKTYGGYNVLAIDLIKEFNPHIADLNWIKAGEQLRLPSLDADTLIRKQPDGSYRLIVGSFLSHQAAERTRDRVRRAGYEVDVTTRRLTDNLEVHRVEMIGLQTREVAQQAWNTALANCWLQITDAPCERTNHG